MFGFIKTAFNIVKGAVKVVKGAVKIGGGIIKNIKAKKQAKKDAALKQNTAQVTEAAKEENAAAPAVGFRQAFAPPAVDAAPAFNQVQTLQDVPLHSVLPAAAPAAMDSKKMMMIGGGVLGLVVLLVVVMKKKR